MLSHAASDGRDRWRGQRGMSLVELLVGVAIGLFVVAGATLVVGTQLGENRRLLLETQLQQDLRAAADILTRDLRRGGYWVRAHESAWSPTIGPASPNPRIEFVVVPGTSIEYRYDRGTNVYGMFGFRLTAGGVLEIQIVDGTWQALTDARTLKVTGMTITQTVTSSPRLACPKACPGDNDSCWPRVDQRDYDIVLTAEARSDSNIQRTLSTAVRLRNDEVVFEAAAGGTACPS